MVEFIKQYDHVLMTDGREGIVVEVFGDQEEFLVDVRLSPHDWDTILATREDIEQLI